MDSGIGLAGANSKAGSFHEKQERTMESNSAVIS